MLVLLILLFIIILHHIIFYPVIAKIFSRKENIIIKDIEYFPTVTILCPAYNEADTIEDKIESFINLDYPKDKIKIIIISDDSTDGTNEIVKKYEKKNYIELVVQKPRKGKVSGHNLIEPTLKSDFIVSTDANSLFKKDAVKILVKNMIADSSLGMAGGKLELKKNNNKDSGEGIFWKFENYLKKIDSNFESIIGANGSLFIIKRELFSQINPGSVDDFERALIVLRKKKKVKYIPEAVVTEDVTTKSSEEFNRKIRIISREWFVLFRNIELLNFVKYPRIAFLLFSHKIIRWMFFLWVSLIYIISTVLMIISDSGLNIVFLIFFIIQSLFYLLGLYGIFKEKKQDLSLFVKLPTYVLTMILSSMLGFIRFLKGNQVTFWNTVREVEK